MMKPTRMVTTMVTTRATTTRRGICTTITRVASELCLSLGGQSVPPKSRGAACDGRKRREIAFAAPPSCARKSMPRQTFDSLDAEIAARETQQQQEAELRKYLVAEVQGLQSALESINSKMAAVKQENVSLAQENIALSAYIDSLMANVHEFGSKIASDTKPTSFLKRFSLGGRRQSVKVVKQGDNIGELETKPERNAPRGWRSCSATPA